MWALWWLIALWTDLTGALAHIGLLHAPWAQDTNYPFLVKSLEIYPLNRYVPPFLFFCIQIGSSTSSFLFFRASIGHADKTKWLQRIDHAFIFSLTFWFIFLIADQCIMNFDLEANHMIQAGFELLTYLLIRQSPQE